MKTFFSIFAAFLFFAPSVFSQSFVFGGGYEFANPVGDFYNKAQPGSGFVGVMEFPIEEDMTITLSFGYFNWKGNVSTVDTGQKAGTFKTDYTAFPASIGLKYYPFYDVENPLKNFYGTIETGFQFFQYDFTGTGYFSKYGNQEGQKALSYGIQLGYEIPLGPLRIDLAGKAQFNFYNIYYGARTSFKIAL